MDTGSIDNYRLEWLSSFLAVVDFGGFAVAAEHTYRSQPRISTHVGELEKHLGAQLFDRKARPVRLTEAGMAFLEHARRVVRDLEAGTSSVQAVIGVLKGRVRLGWYPSVSAAFGPALLSTFTELYPGISVELVETPTSQLTTALREGEADIAIRPLLPATTEPTLQHHVLWEEPLVAIVPDGHSLADRDYIPLSELAEHPIVTYGSDTDAIGNNEVDRALLAAALSPRIVQRTNDPLTLVGLAAAGLGVGLTNLLAASLGRPQGVTVVPLRDAATRRQVCVFWDSAHPQQPATRALVDLIAQFPVPDVVQLYQRRA
ncbi:LysR family transcriptional regulator [Georgenia sp. Z1491]|uniref:LysR family transcriptional regulator n=1 Tax=Georgenia sp. Z1491 TaxID=3416707 RepID=UPI003CEA575A